MSHDLSQPIIIVVFLHQIQTGFQQTDIWATLWRFLEALGTLKIYHIVELDFGDKPIRHHLIRTKPRIHQHLGSPYLIITEEHYTEFVFTPPRIHQIQIYQNWFFLYCTARQHPAQNASTQRHGQPAPTDIWEVDVRFGTSNLGIFKCR